MAVQVFLKQVEEDELEFGLGCMLFMVINGEQFLSSFYGNVDVQHCIVGFVVDLWQIKQVLLGEDGTELSYSLFLYLW